jgi:hypothetical protein
MDRKATTAGADCVLLTSVEIGPDIVISRTVCVWGCSFLGGKYRRWMIEQQKTCGRYPYLKEKFDLPELVPSREEFAVTFPGRSL